MLIMGHIARLVRESMPYGSKQLVKPQKKSNFHLKLRKLRIEAKKKS